MRRFLNLSKPNPNFLEIGHNKANVRLLSAFLVTKLKVQAKTV